MNGHFQLASSADTEPAEGRDTLDVHKDWHGLHFLLARDAWGGEPPLDFIVAGGEEVGEDLGYGPARWFDEDGVREIDVALSHVGDVLAAYDGAAMESLEIYPGGWLEQEEQNRESLKESFARLRAHVARAANERKGMLVYLT